MTKWKLLACCYCYHLQTYGGGPVPQGTAAGPTKPRRVPLMSSKTQQVRDRQICHAEREFGYRVHLVVYRGEKEGGKGREAVRQWSLILFLVLFLIKC